MNWEEEKVLELIKDLGELIKDLGEDEKNLGI